MALGAIIADAVARLSTLYPTLTSAVGHEHVKENDSPPKLLWIPTSDSYQGAVLQRVEPRQLKTRVAGCEVHCWAAGSGGSATKDLDATEVLVNDVIGALHQSAPGAYEITGGAWIPAAKAHQGRAYVLSFAVRVPITLARAGGSVVTITTVQQNVGMTFPDGSTVSGVPGV